MITHIKGRLSEKSPTNVVIETNGIGYWVNISLTTFSQIPRLFQLSQQSPKASSKKTFEKLNLKLPEM